MLIKRSKSFVMCFVNIHNRFVYITYDGEQKVDIKRSHVSFHTALHEALTFSFQAEEKDIDN